MGLFDFVSKRKQRNIDNLAVPAVGPEDGYDTRRGPDARKMAAQEQLAAEDIKERKDFQTYNNSNITFGEDIEEYDFASILRNKQDNIVQLYQLADYFCDADALIHGIVNHVYRPYTVNSEWVLTNANDKTYKIYREYYDQIHMKEKLDSIALQYWKYGNVFVYILNGVPITLPPHRCKIGHVSLNGEPVVDFDCQSIYNEFREKSYSVKENWIKDNNLETYFKGYPPELQKALNENKQYCQLDPKYCKVLQGPKEDWQRYAVPFIASCLVPLSKKALVSRYEDAILELGIHSFIHVKYGDPKRETLPNREQLRGVNGVFSKAMSGFPLATTNYMAEAKVVQPDMDDLFQFDKYKDVNNDILSAGGVSGIIVSGVSEDGSTFASAQVSMETCAARIEAAREEICALMNKVNECIQEQLAKGRSYNINNVPRFEFAPLDMSGKKALREACLKLWEQGCVSTETMMEMHGYSITREKERRDSEKNKGFDESLAPRSLISEEIQSKMTQTESPTMDIEKKDKEETTEEETRGRKTLDDSERTSDPDAARRGAQPKPSNPEGSGSSNSLSG